MIFAKSVIVTFYSQSYLDSIYLFKTFLLIGIFRNNYYGALFTASGQSKIITYYSVLMLMTSLIFSGMLYYFFGLSGIIYGNLFSTAFIAFLQLNHERLLKDFLSDVILDYKIATMIILILIFYYFPSI